MKKRLEMSLVLLVVITTLVVACAPIVQPTPTLATQATVEPSISTKLLFLGNKNIAPVIYLDGTIPSGVAVDLVHALAKHIPQPIEIRAMDWTEAQALVARGEADALIQINVTEERKKLYDFSEPFLESHFSIFAHSDVMGISGISSLRGLRVGVEAGGLPRQLLGQDPLIPLTIIPSFLEGFKSLNEGAIDAVVVDYRVGSYVLAQNGIRNIKVTGEPIQSSYSSIAVKKGNTKLLNEINHALQIIKADGTYQRILNNWGPTEVVFETQQQITDRIYLATTLTLLTLLLITVIWILTTRKQLTKRKAAEEKLREQYSTLRGIINSANALIFSVDRQYRYTSFNQGHAAVMKALYGAEIEQGRSLLEYMTVTEDRDIAKHNLDQALTGEQLVEEAYSGEELRARRYFQVSHSPIKTAEGEVIGIAVLSQDITERKRAEEALRKSEQQLRLIADNIPAIVNYVNAQDLRYRFVNQVYADMYGMSPEQIQGMQVKELLDKAAYARALPFINRARSGERVSYENIVLDRGEPHWFNINYIPEFDAQGAVQSVIVLAVDITERKRAEEALRKSETGLKEAQRLGRLGSWDWDATTDTITWSEEYYHIYGFDPTQRPPGYEEHLKAYTPESAARLDAAVKRNMETGEPYALDLELACANAPSRWITARSETKRDQNGQIVGLRGTAQDITERRRAEEEIRRLNQELEQRVLDRTAQLEAANKELEAFAYSVSHDLRAPLRHIDGFLELLQEKTATSLDAQSQHYMANISDSAKRMGILIDDLLSFSRLGRYEMSKLWVDLGELTQEVIQEFEPETGSRNIHWQIADLPTVTGDCAMLRVVLVNLISNALKFTQPREQAEIEIGCQSQETETIIFVRDNGVGFDPRYADKLFGVFQRLHRADEFEGTGIGLANVRRIINRHGGRTWAKGEVNQGATFYFSLPQTIQGG